MCQNVNPESHTSNNSCCCCCGDRSFPFFRRYYSKKEKQEMLQNYQDQLEKELAGVKEHIQKSLQKSEK